MKLPSARQKAVEILVEADVRGGFVTDKLARLSRDTSCEPEMYPTIQQWVRGVLENQTALDQRLGKRLTGKGIDGLPPAVRAVLRIGAYQLLYLDRSPAPLVINESVNEVRNLGFAGLTKLVNAVLRRISEEPKCGPASATEHLSTSLEVANCTSHPLWLVERWASQFGFERAKSICVANNQKAPLCFRVNELRTSRDDLLKLFESEGVTALPASVAKAAVTVSRLPRSIRIQELRSFKEGLFFVQDESSILVTEVVNAQPGMSVIDLCSAPGGKTCSIALSMRNTGNIVACDSDSDRLLKVRENCERLGITNVEYCCVDARKVTADGFDRVVLDAPCSGLGTVGRRADLRWNKQAEDFAHLTELQHQLLEAASTRLSSGGVLVYSTCSIDKAENEEIANSFVEHHQSFAIQPCGSQFPPGMVTTHGYLRTWPDSHQMSGAFAAAFRRI